MDEQAALKLSQVPTGCPPRASERVPLFSVSALLGNRQCAHLEHRGDIYLLRVTRNGKLILTK